MSKGGQNPQSMGGIPAPATATQLPTAPQTAPAPQQYPQMGGAPSPQGYGVNPYLQASQGMQQAFNTAAAPVTAASGMATYANPFQEQVIENTITRMNEQRDANLMMNQANAARAGAFGGSRHGLIDAQTYADAQQNVGDMVANLSRQGYDSSLNYANRDIANRMAQSQLLGQLGGQAFGMGNTINQNQMQSGAMQQALQQALLGQSQGMFGQYTGQPERMLQQRLAALGMSPLSGNMTTTTEQQSKPGFAEILGGVLGAAGNMFSFSPINLFGGASGGAIGGNTRMF